MCGSLCFLDVRKKTTEKFNVWKEGRIKNWHSLYFVST
jgi:hypothetical protein